MNPNKIGPNSTLPSRRCDIYHSAPAVLYGYKLIFNVPGLPPEPVFANITPDESSDAAVHGVLHWLAPNDFRRIARSEGVLSDISLPLPAFLAPSRTETIAVETIDPASKGHLISVDSKTIVFSSNRIPGFVQRRLKPSRRYVQVAIDGAKYYNLPQNYIENELGKIPVERGVLGAFGLFVEKRPHILDRPNPNEDFGKPTSEMYSPFNPIRAQKAVKTFEDDDVQNTRGTTLRLVHLSNTGRVAASKRRKMYFIPGIDGTGKSILSQLDSIDEEGVYDVTTVIYPFANRQPLQDLALDIIQLLHEDANGNPVSIVGESMGGVLSLMLAVENTRKRQRGRDNLSLDIDLMLLVNPATCYSRSNPRALWDFLLSLGLSEDMYAQLLPAVLLPFVVDVDAMRESFGPSIFPRLRNVLGALSNVSSVLPQDALSWRLKLLQEFSMPEEELALLGSDGGPADIAVISSINDNLIPSHSENYRLRRCIPNLHTMVLPYGGHTPMFDSRFSLSDFLRPFLLKKSQQVDQPSRIVTSHIAKRRAALRKKFKVVSNLGQDDDMSRQSIRKLSDFLQKSRVKTSPVFVGEENIPQYNPERPVLFVSNHTLLGWLDSMFPVERMLKTRNVLIRSLAHPKLFDSNEIAFPDTPRFTNAELEEFGIRTVSPNSLLEQLACGQWSFLFPGGAREALKQPNDKKYDVVWPEEPEFVRACALFGATVIPTSTVGSEDSVRLLLSSKQVSDILKAGSNLTGRAIDFDQFRDTAKKWRGGGDESEVVMLPPFGVPREADRIYFRFGKAIEIPPECVDDEDLEKDVYRKIRGSVKEGIDVLLRRREKDEFRSLDSRREFSKSYGNHVEPPAGTGWAWMKAGAYLDDDLQPPL